MPAPASFPVRGPRPGSAWRTGRSRVAPERGAVLIVALLVTAIIAVVLGSYLNLNLSSTRLAKRTFNGYAALNLAEAGAEEAVWSFNRATAGDAAAWESWKKDGASARQKLGDFDFGGNTSGSAKVYVDNYNPGPNARPKVVVQSSISSPADDTPALRMIEVTLRRRAFFANGLVAKESVVFNGNATVDSWNSDPDANASTAPIEYDFSIRTDKGTVASTAFENTAVVVNQAHVWGYVATGGAAPQVGTNGTIRGATTADGVAIDPERVSTDFNAEFTPVAAPTDGTTIATVGATLGTAGTATRWRTPGIVLGGNDTLTILGDVTLILLAGPGTPAIAVTGNAAIHIPEKSSLTIYTQGDMKIAGKGLGNSNVQPVSCKIWGTNQSPLGHELDIVGNGALKTVIYAPNAHVKINGNGDVMGSIVAKKITLVGNAKFHYDEALAQLESNEPFGIQKWRELSTAAEREPYSALFEGW